MNMSSEKDVLECSHCGWKDFYKYGKNNGKQVYKCNKCHRKFFDNIEEIRLKYRIKEYTIIQKQKGDSYRTISKSVLDKYNVYVTPVTIMRWFKKFGDYKNE